MTIKKVSLIIVLCLILNNAAVLGGFETPVDVRAPVVESAVFGLISLVRLPFTVTAGLLQEKPLLPEYRQTPKKQDTNKAQKNKKDNVFLLANLEKDVRNNAKLNSSGVAGTHIAKDMIQAQEAGVMWANLVIFWLGFKYIFLLACLLALSKSNLPWEIMDSYV